MSAALYLLLLSGYIQSNGYQLYRYASFWDNIRYVHLLQFDADMANAIEILLHEGEWEIYPIDNMSTGDLATQGGKESRHQQPWYSFKF